MVLGADLGWVSQLESRGVRWVDDKGDPIDPIQAVKNLGANTVRLRVFVDPPEDALWQKKDGTVCMLGFADAGSVLAVSERVRDMGMDLMIDFHYSDHFADPEYQDIPKAWENDDAKGLARRVYAHTKEVLTMLTEKGIFPGWVQVGNEINPGILLPEGSLKEAPENLIAFLNAGYDAVKECCPECRVITHTSGVHSPQWCEPFWDKFFECGGKTDVMGFSHYPYWFNTEQSADFLHGYLAHYLERYQKPIMICEIGSPEDDEDKSYELILNTVTALKRLPENMGLGALYWEPEVGAALLPDKYPLGASRLLGENTLQFTRALRAYGDVAAQTQRKRGI